MTTDTSYELETADPYCAWPPAAVAAVQAAPWRRVVAVGDSVAAGIRESLNGYRDLDGTGRVVDAMRAAHPTTSYHHLGVRDLLIAEIREQQLAPALELRPDLAVVAGGGNDAFRRSFDPDRVARELSAILEPLVAQGAQVATIGLFDLPRSGLVPEPHAGPIAERFDELARLLDGSAGRN